MQVWGTARNACKTRTTVGRQECGSLADEIKTVSRELRVHFIRKPVPVNINNSIIMYGIRTRAGQGPGGRGKQKIKIYALTHYSCYESTHTMHFRRRSSGPCNGASPLNPRRSGFCARHYHNRVRRCAQVFCIHYTGRVYSRTTRRTRRVVREHFLSSALHEIESCHGHMSTRTD